MKIGDLVKCKKSIALWLNRENGIGIVSKTNGSFVEVLWNDGSETQIFFGHLEVINEDR